MPDYYYISDGSEPRGPYAKDQLRSMWNSGQITATTLFCVQGSEEWKSIEELTLAEGENTNAAKTFTQAYFSWSGLGLFDLIPGIRDLPYFVRFALMVTVVLALCLILLPKVFQRDNRTPEELPPLIVGDPPSVQLAPCFSPILSPLDEGASSCDSGSISRMLLNFQVNRGDATEADKPVYSTAADTASVLREALQDRNRHLEKLAKLAAGSIADSKRQHLALAIGVSWQRNAQSYRNRIRELFLRLLSLEKDRFSSDSASASTVDL